MVESLILACLISVPHDCKRIKSVSVDKHIVAVTCKNKDLTLTTYLANMPRYVSTITYERQKKDVITTKKGISVTCQQEAQ